MLPPYMLLTWLLVPILLAIAARGYPDPSPSPFLGVGFPSRAVGRQASTAHTTTPTNPAVLAAPNHEREPLQEEEDGYEVDILPFVLVSSIDGALHAVDRETGDVLWTLRDGVEPLVGGKVHGRPEHVQYIVEPLSGSLYVYEQNEDDPSQPKVRKLPFSVEQLIDLSPFTFPQSPNRIFTGSKHTSLITIDLRTGQQLDCFSTPNPYAKLSKAGICESDPLDDLEGRPSREILFVGRTDYSLMITTPPTTVDYYSATATASAKTKSVQEITYSTYTPNSYDRPLAQYWARTGAQNWGDGQRIRVELGTGGEAYGVQEGLGQKWYSNLDSVGVAVYDVVLPLSPVSDNPVILPQPRAPAVKDLFPSLPAHHPALLSAAKTPSTYIGKVDFVPTLPPLDSSRVDDDNKSATRPDPRPLLFAQSSNSYPLIKVINHPPNPVTKINGTFALSDELPSQDDLMPTSGGGLGPLERHARQQRLLDPPKEESVRISAPASTEAQLDLLIRQRADEHRRWWYMFVAEIAGVVITGMAVYRWAFVKATKAAAAEKMPAATLQAPLLTPPLEDEKRATTPTVRFESLPDTSSNGSAGGDTGTPKKKSTRRRVRGKKKRRNSVGPELDRDDGDGDGDGDGDDGENDAMSSTSEERGRSEERNKWEKVEKPLPEIPRNPSSISVNDEQERLAISDTVIGFGSHGTVVLKGTWGGRPVAVKRLLSDFVRLASQEVKLLQASDDHPNVIRYYCQERRDNFLYIALDLCQASLADLIEAPDRHMELAAVLDPKKALQQITAGLKHLHGMKIIHRDIKPQNVLVSRAGNDRSLRMLVSDFGLARRLEQGQSSFAPTANNLAGSLGWRAPECIRGQVKLNEGFDPVLSCGSSGSTASSTGSLVDLTELVDGEGRKGAPRARLTKAVDLFALGCLYFWVLMNGEHPFGETYNRESNIVKGEAVNMDMLTVLGEEGVEAQHLIGRLLSTEPSERPDTAECLIHPLFWTPGKRLAFLCDASDRFEIMDTDPPESTLVMLETDAQAIVGRDWYSRMDRVFTSSLGKYRKYKGNTVRDLLRAMRNKKHHYQDLELSAQRHFGALPAGFLNYFTSRFPKLLLHVYGVVRDSRLRHETMFDSYFQE